MVKNKVFIQKSIIFSVNYCSIWIYSFSINVFHNTIFVSFMVIVNGVLAIANFCSICKMPYARTFSIVLFTSACDLTDLS